MNNKDMMDMVEAFAGFVMEIVEKERDKDDKEEVLKTQKEIIIKKDVEIAELQARLRKY